MQDPFSTTCPAGVASPASPAAPPPATEAAALTAPRATGRRNALIAAARDGVDVRLLVPGTVDVFGVGAMSRAGYRALLEGGVRIFEWNGVMLHAKTAVADRILDHVVPLLGARA